MDTIEGIVFHSRRGCKYMVKSSVLDTRNDCPLMNKMDKYFGKRVRITIEEI